MKSVLISIKVSAEPLRARSTELDSLTLTSLQKADQRQRIAVKAVHKMKFVTGQISLIQGP